MTSQIILMADNNPDFLEVRREFLEDVGYTVITAYNPSDAENILKRGGVDLAILDIRMLDDDDEQDTSGLEIARKFGQALPVIMLTGYPTWEHVKAALEPNLNGLSSAVDFIAKSEGPLAMLQAVNLTLMVPRFKRNVLDEFNAETTQAFHDTLRCEEPEDLTEKFKKSLERTEQDLLQFRQELFRQSERYQEFAIRMGLLGIGIILVGAFLVFFEIMHLAVLSGVASIVSEAISILFIRRAVQSSRHVDQQYRKLQEIYQASHLISICDTIKRKSKRENTKIMVIEKLTEHWFGDHSQSLERNCSGTETGALRGQRS